VEEDWGARLSNRASHLSVAASAGTNTWRRGPDRGPHIRSVYAKLGVPDRSSAVRRARGLRLLSAGRMR